ncbi:MAG: MFS transporter, partial [Chloroflexota bacterium]|nr:MFS transporter [Chloroflexota bacterium]
IADANFRRFLSFRVLFAVASLSDPFLVIFAASELALPASYVGAYVMALVGGMLASSPLWLSVERRSGYRGVLQLSALIRLVAPLLALMLPFLAQSDFYQENVTSDTVLPVLFSLAFVAIGVSLGGQSRASTTYLSEIAPGRRRESFGSITNAALAVAAMAPLLGGWIVERRDYPALFIAAILIGLLAVFVSGALTDTHVRTRPTATAWRLRRAMPSTTADRRRP